MRLRDISVRELLESPLMWEDFEDDPNDRESLLESMEGDPEAVLKIRLLDQIQRGDLLDKHTLRDAEFYEAEFTEYARLFVAEGEYAEGGSPRGQEIDYLRDYSGLKLLIQDLGGVYAVYLKDYEFGFIRPLGMCVYEYYPDDERLITDEAGRKEFIRTCILPELEVSMWEESFDLKKELHDYYHNIPDIGSPFIEQRMDLEGLLTAREAATKLGVSVPRIKQMVDEGLIDGYKFGSRLLITASSVEGRIAYIKEHGVPTRGKSRKSKKGDVGEETMKDLFIQYLIGQGYSRETPSGNPSTVYTYATCIANICEREHISWQELSRDVDRYVQSYDFGGAEEEYGSKSHGSPRAAIQCFRSFVKSRG